MKRIPKGWIYRVWPRPYEAIVEGPDYEVFRAQTFNERPTLPEISRINMKASEKKYEPPEMIAYSRTDCKVII